MRVAVPNTARFLFLDPRAREFFLEWDSAAANLVANLRRELGSDPLNRDLTRLIDDLNRESPEFLTLWSRMTSGLTTQGSRPSTTRSSATCI